jgi:hypothetical protein
LKPCDKIPGIPCAHDGRCFGAVMWDGKREEAQPLAKVQECKHVEECREWWRREGKDGRIAQ